MNLAKAIEIVLKNPGATTGVLFISKLSHLIHGWWNIAPKQIAANQ
tara:strand:- start:509 stop:646 length:138 start_codon:yes stop_codon:yes gene_type:complete